MQSSKVIVAVKPVPSALNVAPLRNVTPLIVTSFVYQASVQSVIVVRPWPSKTIGADEVEP